MDCVFDTYSDRASLYCPGWSTMEQSRLTETYASRDQHLLHPPHRDARVQGEKRDVNVARMVVQACNPSTLGGRGVQSQGHEIETILANMHSSRPSASSGCKALRFSQVSTSFFWLQKMPCVEIPACIALWSILECSGATTATVASISQAQAICPPQPLKQLGPQAIAIKPGDFIIIIGQGLASYFATASLKFLASGDPPTLISQRAWIIELSTSTKCFPFHSFCSSPSYILKEWHELSHDNVTSKFVNLLPSSQPIKNYTLGQVWWLTPVIPALWEAEAGGLPEGPVRWLTLVIPALWKTEGGSQGQEFETSLTYDTDVHRRTRARRARKRRRASAPLTFGLPDFPSRRGLPKHTPAGVEEAGELVQGAAERPGAGGTGAAGEALAPAFLASALAAFTGEYGTLGKELQGPAPAPEAEFGFGWTLGASALGPAFPALPGVGSGAKVKGAQGLKGVGGGPGGGGGGVGGGEARPHPLNSARPGDAGLSPSPFWLLGCCGDSGLEPSDGTEYLRLVSRTGSFFTSRGVRGDSSEAGEQVTGVGGNTSRGGR
ncbi:LOW QUALITY PROTEIN: hypothetical protein AAY473_015319 [Plecturocebus cupreus]